MTAPPRTDVGFGVAQILTRSWRSSLERYDDVAAAIDSAPLLLSTGSGPLAWRRISTHPDADAASELRNDYYSHAAQALFLEESVIDVFRRLRENDVESVLFKGWALARLYPEAGLRPYGDIDVWVSPQGLPGLRAALQPGEVRGYCVEPHVSFYRQYERSFDEIIRRSILISQNGVQIRVPSDEDHLRFICLHFLFHGGWRPLWLCDVALMVESAGTAFDWDLCLGGKRKHSDWILCVIALAHDLLGANIEDTPAARRVRTLPEWLKTAVLRQWGNGPGMSLTEDVSFAIPKRLLKPKQLAKSIREHWRNPIQASVEMNAWFDESPRGLLQLASLFWRVPNLVKSSGGNNAN